MKRWTSLLVASALALAAAVQPMALESLREQEAGEAAAEQLAQAPSQPEPRDDGGAQEDETAREDETAHEDETAGAGAVRQEPASPAPEASPAASTEQALLNGADLDEALDPSSAALDDLVTSVMDGILTDEMDTYEKVKACYDYVIDNTGYGNHMAFMSTPIGGGTCWDVYLGHGEVEGFGAVALTAGKGMCNAYASAFILMARRLGLDANLVKGYTLGGGGGYSCHEWAEVGIGGTPYVFDPQLEQDLVKSGLPAYSVFCKPYAVLGARYRK